MMNKDMQKTPLQKVLYFILPIISIGILFLGWFSISAERPDLFPGPAATWERFQLLLEKPIGRITLVQHILDSLRRVGISVGLACILGIAFGVMLGWSRRFRATFGVLFEIIRPIPPLAWIPLITIWFGIGELPKILIVFIGTFANVVVNTATGVRMVDRLQLDVGKIFGANTAQTLWQIVLPASLPAIFAGIRTALGAGWAVVLAAEMLGATSGVGFLITRGNEIGDTALIIVCMFIIGLVGAVLSVVASFFERKVCPWRAN
jgi:taurine transport system permease protein